MFNYKTKCISVFADHDCKRSAMGEYYKGNLAVSTTGKQCLPWESFLTEDDWMMKFPDTSHSELSNYCRNPDRKPLGPWCYVDPDGQWEYCNIPLCPGVCIIGLVRILHYTDVKSPAFRLFTQSFVQAQIKESIKAPRHWTLREEFTLISMAYCCLAPSYRYVIYIHKSHWWDVLFVFRCLTEEEKDGLCWPALSGHWLSCILCWPYLTYYEIINVWAAVSAFVRLPEMFMSTDVLFKNGLN